MPNRPDVRSDAASRPRHDRQASDTVVRGPRRDGSIEWVVGHAGNFLGVARLHSFDQQHRCAMYAVGFFDYSKLGQGLGRTVTRLVLHYAFDELGLESGRTASAGLQRTGAALQLVILATSREALGITV